MMQREQICSIFETEFATMRDKFALLDLAVSDAANDKSDHVANPGVYVFWHPDRGVIRVGRSFDNARKRAMQHISANTGGVMSNLVSDPGARLLLFSVKDKGDAYWIASLEVLFEQRCSPEVRSGRIG